MPVGTPDDESQNPPDPDSTTDTGGGSGANSTPETGKESTQDETEPSTAAGLAEPVPGHNRKQLSALLVLGAVALLLVGAVVGLLLRTTFDGGDDNRPAADSAAVGFSQDMIRHHQQAVEMATIELYGGSDPQVRSLAYDILTSQTNQVGQMQSWLSRWDYPLDNPGEPMSWMEGHSGGHAHGGAGTEPSTDMTMNMSDSGVPMPGMASTDDMNKLRTLQGAELDKYFLQLMLRHHQGGLEMMEFATEPDHVSEDYVRRLAQQMVNVQQSESDTMTKMLETRGAQPLPMN
ncbi:DUF305 domain-containing protein [Gordonia rubripertincta]|uniref:DUF305 domain-containing protein n=1 Tax=Gordonia rubripertincta TaxID=36822 RepID=A0ABT4N3H0_GORRU|nr:DUF305 domain-containing protein [Gordonia rubripertincta]MCZ4552946.1 DUF305 domain-containing protein [Gordonia rubripertincta]